MKENEAMHHPRQLYGQVVECLTRSECTALATIIARTGSGPREAGAAMVVREDGRTLGTVGGGLFEAQTKEIAGKVLRERLPACRTFSFAGQLMEEGGMICGGEAEVLVDFLDAAEPSCGRIFSQILKDQEAGRPSWLVRSIRIEKSGGSLKTGLGLLGEEGLDAGSLDLSCLDQNRLKEACRQTEPVLIPCGEVRYFIQPAALPETVFIFGAGHIARELAPICSALGFRTVVIDDRSDFANAERFPTATRLLVAESYEDCFGRLDIDEAGYIVIVTHGHAHDRTVLSFALKTPARYIGMIASRRKREIIYRSLEEEGAALEDLARAHSPIGLDIGARTPAEIAVSIAAELIAVRTGRIK
jgi:xanthine dehydrogenase accessory factor